MKSENLKGLACGGKVGEGLIAAVGCLSMKLLVLLNLEAYKLLWSFKKLECIRLNAHAAAMVICYSSINGVFYMI